MADKDQHGFSSKDYGKSGQFGGDFGKADREGERRARIGQEAMAKVAGNTSVATTPQETSWWDNTKSWLSNVGVPAALKTGQYSLSTDPMMMAGLTLGKVMNFNPHFNEEGDVTKTGLIGGLTTGVHGAYNPENYNLGPYKQDMFNQEAMNALYNPDHENTDILGNPGYTVNEDAFKDVLAKYGVLGQYEDLSLEKSSEQIKEERELERKLGGGNNTRPPIPMLTEEQIIASNFEGDEEKLALYKSYIQKGYPADYASMLVGLA